MEIIPTSMSLPGIENKVDLVVKHCFYMIATGKWLPGDMLPSVRSAEKKWNVHYLTILKAYKTLEKKGFVESQPRSGYYVSENELLPLHHKNNFEIGQIFDNVYGYIKEELKMFPLGVFRSIGKYAEERLRQKPECAFVECTPQQSNNHAKEISERLNVPILSLTIDEISSTGFSYYESTSVLFTTFFHQEEIQSLVKISDFKIVSVPIIVSPSLRQKINQEKREIIFFESDQTHKSITSSDAFWMMDIRKPNVKISRDVNRALQKLFPQSRSENQPLVLISHYCWDSLDSKWKKHPNVFLLEFQISPSAWPSIFSALNMVFDPV